MKIRHEHVSPRLKCTLMIALVQAADALDRAGDSASAVLAVQVVRRACGLSSEDRKILRAAERIRDRAVSRV